MFFQVNGKLELTNQFRNEILLHKSNISNNSKNKLTSDKHIITLPGRIACTTSFRKKFRRIRVRDNNHLYVGSLTIEAALVLPIFLFFLIGLLQFMLVIQTEAAVRTSLWETAKFLSTEAYKTVSYKDEIGEIYDIVSEMEVHSSFIKKEGKDFWDKSIVVGGSKGFSFARSTFFEQDGYLDLIVTYDVHVPFLLLDTVTIPQLQRCYVRGWIGEGEQKAEQIVYVTQSGTVYHLSEQCSHLKLTIQEIAPAQLPAARNNGGGKYVPCEKCGKKALEGGKYFITREGECFHTTRSCSGLKRSVLVIPISKVGKRTLCKRCGG